MTPANCTNCGVPVTGKYCSACGQSVEYHLHSLWDLLGEAAEVFTHADSRLWRTLAPLLIRPGFLTQQFLAGAPRKLYTAIPVVLGRQTSCGNRFLARASKVKPTTAGNCANTSSAMHCSACRTV
jgi:hypothetical protein